MEKHWWIARIWVNREITKISYYGVVNSEKKLTRASENKKLKKNITVIYFLHFINSFCSHLLADELRDRNQTAIFEKEQKKEDEAYQYFCPDFSGGFGRLKQGH